MHTKTEMIFIRNRMKQCNIGIREQYTLYISYINQYSTKNSARMAAMNFTCSLVQPKGMVICNKCH